jgi:hypothetical protein
VTYRCVVCGEQHDDLPDLGADCPDPYLALPKSQRKKRADYTPDRCVVRDDDGEHYFIRGVIRFPIRKSKDVFGVGAWVSQSRVNFERYARDEKMEEPTFGWLSNRLAHYEEDTFLLKTQVHFRGAGERPWIVLEPTQHLAAVEQREGITRERAWEIVHRYMP